MEKARLTKKQADTLKRLLDEYKENYPSPLAQIVHHQVLSKEGRFDWEWSGSAMEDLDVDELCRAVFVGIEIIEEDQTVIITEKVRQDIRELFECRGESKKFDEGFDLGVKRVLLLSGITIKGINA